MEETLFYKISEYFEFSFEFGVHKIHNSNSFVREMSADIKYIPYLRAENCKNSNIYLRPLPINIDNYMLIDDLSEELVTEHLNKPGRMVVESSPKNFQVWLHTSKPFSDAEKKIMLLHFGSDPNANPNKRWGRAPGFTNRKANHLKPNGFYPYAKLHYLDCNPADINLPVHMQQICNKTNASSNVSNMSVSASSGISRKDYETGDPSRTDFRFIMALIKRGATDYEIRQNLIAERTDWQNHYGVNRFEQYLARTIAKARLWTK